MPELTNEQLAAFIGPKWEDTYRHKLAAFREDASFVPTWNWSAALLTPIWLMYRKLYLGLGIYVLASLLAGPLIVGPDAAMDPASLVDNPRLAALLYSIRLSLGIAFGGSGNWFLYRRARAASRLVQARSGASPESMAFLGRIGGVNKRGAAVVVALGILMVLVQVLVPGVQP